jgi:hypothetical protein
MYAYEKRMEEKTLSIYLSTNNEIVNVEREIYGRVVRCTITSFACTSAGATQKPFYQIVMDCIRNEDSNVGGLSGALSVPRTFNGSTDHVPVYWRGDRIPNRFRITVYEGGSRNPALAAVTDGFFIQMLYTEEPEAEKSQAWPSTVIHDV